MLYDYTIMTNRPIKRWLTASESASYSGFTCSIINDALRKGRIASNLVFRSESGGAERLIDRYSLDEWIGTHVPVPCAAILTWELLQRIPAGCYIASNSGRFGVHLEPGVRREDVWQAAVDADADWRRCYLTESEDEFRILMAEWDPDDERGIKRRVRLQDQFGMLDDEISLGMKVG